MEYNMLFAKLKVPAVSSKTQLPLALKPSSTSPDCVLQAADAGILGTFNFEA